jgi:hypothetical protein
LNRKTIGLDARRNDNFPQPSLLIPSPSYDAVAYTVVSHLDPVVFTLEESNRCVPEASDTVVCSVLGPNKLSIPFRQISRRTIFPVTVALAQASAVAPSVA